jgi:dephospho-CoA kinase
MQKILKIGITGGIGVGKSVVAMIFNQLGVPIYDADTRAKWLLTHDLLLIKEIKENFGEEAYLPTGELNKRHLAEQVFIDNDKIRIMNNLVHPKVGLDSQYWLEANSGKYPYLLKEAALLYESGSDKGLDKIIVVTAPLEVRLARIQARDPQRSREEILGIVEKQMPESEKIAKADFLIQNDGTQALIPQVLELHQRLLALIT